jgi:hypothetical protein
MTGMMPLLITALLVWAGVFAFLFAVDRKISAVEKRINSRNVGGGDTDGPSGPGLRPRPQERPRSEEEDR